MRCSWSMSRLSCSAQLGRRLHVYSVHLKNWRCLDDLRMLATPKKPQGFAELFWCGLEVLHLHVAFCVRIRYAAICQSSGIRHFTNSADIAGERQSTPAALYVPGNGDAWKVPGGRAGVHTATPSDVGRTVCRGWVDRAAARQNSMHSQAPRATHSVRISSLFSLHSLLL